MTQQFQKVEITRNTMAGGKPVKIGDVVTLQTSEARFLVNIGKAKLTDAEETTPAAKKPAAGKVETNGEGVQLEKMKVDELKAFAEKEGIEIPETVKLKADILNAVKIALVARLNTGAKESDETKNADNGANGQDG